MTGSKRIICCQLFLFSLLFGLVGCDSQKKQSPGGAGESPTPIPGAPTLSPLSVESNSPTVPDNNIKIKNKKTTIRSSVPTISMNKEGDYLETQRVKGERPTSPGYLRWEVTDPDLEGLACRMKEQLRPLHLAGADLSYEQYQENFIDNPSNVSQWSVVTTFPSRERIEAVTGNWGSQQIMIIDDRGKPWIGIQGGEEQGDCFVRANSQFVRPIIPDGSEGWKCYCRANDCGSRSHPNSVYVSRSKEVDPSSLEYACVPLSSDL